jgi:putative endopeptidase
MNAYEINAYYDQNRNEIVFPAGILQYPLFDKNRSVFQNYGFIGTIIGHEIIHGYDDQGRKYDHNGNMVNWWSKHDLDKFVEIGDSLIKQYNSYVINGRPLNGKLTLGENIADLGGVSLAYRAVISHCEENHIKIRISDKREFFISYAKIWRRLTRPEHLLVSILSDPHSPDRYRTYIVRNIDEFYLAFKDESKYLAGGSHTNTMYLAPDLRIKIW